MSFNNVLKKKKTGKNRKNAKTSTIKYYELILPRNIAVKRVIQKREKRSKTNVRPIAHTQANQSSALVKDKLTGSVDCYSELAPKIRPAAP